MLLISCQFAIVSNLRVNVSSCKINIALFIWQRTTSLVDVNANGQKAQNHVARAPLHGCVLTFKYVQQ